MLPRDYYGGHFEVFAVKTGQTQRVGTVNMKRTKFYRMGKGGLSAAFKIGYDSNFDPYPINTFEDCSWVKSLVGRENYPGLSSYF